jgi:predicted dehydrogenase
LSRIGLIGCGRWGANVLSDLVTLGADVVVCDPDPARRELASTAGAIASVADLDRLSECDGYVVVTPAPSHREVVTTILARGAPVFVEKPPGTNLVEVEAMVAHGDGRLFVMHKWRWHPGIRELARIASSGRLGEPLELHTVRTGPEQLPDGVDVVWHLGAHDLSIALEVLGDVASVDDARGDRDDTGRIERCRVRMVHGSQTHEMILGAGQAERVRRVELRGPAGHAVLEQPDAHSVVLQVGSERKDVAISSEQPLEAELRDFLTHLVGGPPPRSGGDAAVAIARTMAEIQQLVGGTGL